MNFFNIGTAELLLIFAIALIVVGPRRLPEIAQGLGKIVNDVRKMSQEFTIEMTRELNVSLDSKENEKSMTKDHPTKDHPTKDHPTNDHLNNNG